MHLRFTFAQAVFVGLALSGCAGTNVTPGPSAVSPASQAMPIGLGSPVPALRRNPNASYKRALYVADADANDVKIYTNTYYREVGTISNGIQTPVAETMDKRGNLYVANFGTTNHGFVSEYAPGATAPSFTYNAGISNPEAMAVDRQGNVFVANSRGSINQYFQGVNYVAQSCPDLNSYSDVPSVAVDASGDVFVTFVVGYNAGIYEYKGGLSGCNPTFLVAINAFGLAVDSNNNLIAATGGGGTVDVLAPPYTYVSRQIGSGFSFAASVFLNKKNKLAFVTDEENDTVTVVNYQTGENIKVLGKSNGISYATSAVDAPNYVP